MGRDRPAHHRVPLVPPTRCAARAEAGGRGSSSSRVTVTMPPAGREGRQMLVATDVHRHFEGMRAVDGVSIEVPAGQITGLIGPNGAGKSTFLAVMAGTLPASSGTIVFDGADITRLPAYA